MKNNKKGAVEIPIGTLVIIVIVAAMLILGLVFVEDIRNRKPQFSVSKEECRKLLDLSFIYNEEKLTEKGITFGDMIYFLYLGTGYLENYEVKRMSNGDSWVYRVEEICEEVEVDEIILDKIIIIEYQNSSEIEYLSIDKDCRKISENEYMCDLSLSVAKIFIENGTFYLPPTKDTTIKFIISSPEQTGILQTIPKSDLSENWLSKNAECMNYKVKDKQITSNYRKITKECSEWKIGNYIVRKK